MRYNIVDVQDHGWYFLVAAEFNGRGWACAPFRLDGKNPHKDVCAAYDKLMEKLEN